MNTSNEKEQGRGAGQLLLLMAAFGLPMVGAWFLYFNPDLLPGGRSNRGELVQPVHPISDQVFFNAGWSDLLQRRAEGVLDINAFSG